jgi:hypothetical protein
VKRLFLAFVLALAGCSEKPPDRELAACEIDAARLAHTADPDAIDHGYLLTCMQAKGYELDEKRLLGDKVTTCDPAGSEWASKSPSVSPLMMSACYRRAQ